MTAARDPAVRLRELTDADLDRVAELEPELFGAASWSRRTYADELRAPERHYVAAVDALGDVVGYAGVAVGADSEVMTIGVVDGWRRAGIGTRLLAELLAYARAARSRRVFLEVRASSLGAQLLYERAGFRRVAVRRGYYQPEGADAVIMRLDLRPAGRPVGAEAVPSRRRSGDDDGE